MIKRVALAAMLLTGSVPVGATEVISGTLAAGQRSLDTKFYLPSATSQKGILTATGGTVASVDFFLINFEVVEYVYTARGAHLSDYDNSYTYDNPNGATGPGCRQIIGESSKCGGMGPFRYQVGLNIGETQTGFQLSDNKDVTAYGFPAPGFRVDFVSRSPIGGNATFVTFHAEFTPTGNEPISYRFELADPAAVLGVPEPMTWSLMLVGFGFIGSVARRHRLNLHVIAA